jgi:hypothetical protein
VSQADTQSVLAAQTIRNRRGQIVSVILTAQVGAAAPGSGTPTGTVQYFVKGRSRPIATLTLHQGAAILTVKPALALNKAISIRYGGDSHFEASTSPKLTLTKRGLTTMARPFAAFFSRGRQPAPLAARSLPVLARASGSVRLGHHKGQ